MWSRLRNIRRLHSAIAQLRGDSCAPGVHAAAEIKIEIKISMPRG
jgi:hypothetical protein